MYDEKICNEYVRALSESNRWKEHKKYVEMLYSHAQHLAYFISEGKGCKAATVVLKRMEFELKRANHLYENADKECIPAKKAYKEYCAKKGNSNAT